MTLIHRCHLALFYMRGIFYHIAKRFTGIHYVSIPWILFQLFEIYVCHYDLAAPLGNCETIKQHCYYQQKKYVVLSYTSFFQANNKYMFIVQLLVRRGIGEESRSNYGILGWLSLIQLAVAFLHQSYKLYQQHNRNTRKTNSQGQSYQESTSTRFRTDLSSFVMSKDL